LFIHFLLLPLQSENNKQQMNMANKKVKTLNVMNSLNGHNPCIVNEINGLFNHKGYADYCGTILHALAVRYKDEIEEKSGNGIVINNVDDALTNAEFLLMNVFDNEDLTMILDFCYGNFKRYRNDLATEIINIVKSNFNGRYKFINNFSISYFKNGDLIKNDFENLSEIKGDSFTILDKEANLFFSYGEYSFPIYELERILKHLKANAVKSYKLRVYASREIEVKASSIEEAKNMVKDIVNGDPLVSADVDDIQRVCSEEEYKFSTNEDDYLFVLNDDTCANQKIYAIYSDASCKTHLFDVLEEEFIAMLNLGLINDEGSYYFLMPLSNEDIKKYRKMFATGFRDIFDKIKNNKC